MILFLILLVLAAAGVGLYATENTGTHDVTLWQWHWSAVPDWVPVVATAAVIVGLFVLYMLYSGLVHGVRVGSMRKRVTTRESTISDLRRENQRLREEDARGRSAGRAALWERPLAPVAPAGSRGRRGRAWSVLAPRRTGHGQASANGSAPFSAE